MDAKSHSELPRLRGTIKMLVENMFLGADWKNLFFNLVGDKLFYFKSKLHLEHIGFLVLTRIKSITLKDECRILIETQEPSNSSKLTWLGFFSVEQMHAWHDGLEICVKYFRDDYQEVHGGPKKDSGRLEVKTKPPRIHSFTEFLGNALVGPSGGWSWDQTPCWWAHPLSLISRATAHQDEFELYDFEASGVLLYWHQVATFGHGFIVFQFIDQDRTALGSPLLLDVVGDSTRDTPTLQLRVKDAIWQPTSDPVKEIIFPQPKNQALNWLEVQLGAFTQAKATGPNEQYPMYSIAWEVMEAICLHLFQAKLPTFSIVQAFSEQPRPRTPNTPPNLKEGDIVRRCKIQNMLGKGGFGIVWKGLDVTTKSPVAIKQALPDQGVQKDWFNREVETHIKICQDPNTPRVPKFITQSKSQEFFPFFVMEFIPGETAETYYEKGSKNVLIEPKAISFLLQTLETLESIHQKGILHRDLKPSNIIIHNETGEPWIFDFGIAKDIGLAGQNKQTITNVGSMAYRAPEYLFITGNFTDIYSLGATLLALTSLLSDDDTLWNPVVERCRFSQGLKVILNKMIAFEYKERFQNCSEVISALKRLSLQINWLWPTVSS